MDMKTILERMKQNQKPKPNPAPNCKSSSSASSSARLSWKLRRTTNPPLNRGGATLTNTKEVMICVSSKYTDPLFPAPLCAGGN